MDRYQAGGLAAAVGPPATEEEMGPPASAITAEEIVERTVNPREGKSLTELIFMNQQNAIDRLRQTRENIASRRADYQEQAKRDRWLALAQGMLAPTRTGGFGESLGMAAGAIREQRAAEAEREAAFDAQIDDLASQEIAAEADMIDQLLKEAGYGNRAKTLHGAVQTMVAPEDRDKPISQQRVIFGVVRQGEDGKPEMEALTDPEGNYFLEATRLDPVRVAALTEAAERAESKTVRSEDFINEGYSRREPLVNLRRAIALLENSDVELKTSTIQQWKTAFANTVGIDLGDTTELTEWQMAVADDFLNTLTQLKGPSSDRDVSIIRGYRVGMGQNTEANYRRLRQIETTFQGAVRRAIREAWQSGDKDAVADLWESVDLNPWKKGARPIPATREAYDDLPGDTWFFIEDDWGGVLRHKPKEE